MANRCYWRFAPEAAVQAAQPQAPPATPATSSAGGKPRGEIECHGFSQAAGSNVLTVHGPHGRTLLLRTDVGDVGLIVALRKRLPETTPAESVWPETSAPKMRNFARS